MKSHSKVCEKMSQNPPKHSHTGSYSAHAYGPRNDYKSSCPSCVMQVSARNPKAIFLRHSLLPLLVLLFLAGDKRVGGRQPQPKCVVDLESRVSRLVGDRTKSPPLPLSQRGAGAKRWHVYWTCAREVTVSCGKAR